MIASLLDNRARLLIDASLWSADLSAVGESIDRVNRYVDLFHLDVSDNQFAPGLLFFPDLLSSIRNRTDKPLHVHLMVRNPLDLLSAFSDAGADLITVHLESDDAMAALAKIRQLGKLAGIAVGHDTDPRDVTPDHLEVANIVLMVGTQLGTRGSAMCDDAPERLATMASVISDSSVSRPIFADGGIRTASVPPLVSAGANAVVVGSLLFRSPDLQRTVDWLGNQSLPPLNQSMPSLSRTPFRPVRGTEL